MPALQFSPALRLRFFFLFLLILGLTLSIPSTAQQEQDEDDSHATPAQNKPTGQPTTPDSPKPDASKTDYSKEGFVVEQLKTRCRFENDGTGRIEKSYRIRVQSENGLRAWGQLKLGYNAANEKLEIEKVQVTKPDGSVVTAGPEAVQDLNGPLTQNTTIYTDYHEKHVTVPGLRPGDTLDVASTVVIQTALAPNQFWMQHDFQKQAIVLAEELEIDIPAARTVKLKTHPGLDPKVNEENGRRIYRWETNNLEVEDQTSEKDNAAPRKKLRKANETAAVQLTSFASWDEVGRWYAGLEKDARTPTPAVRAKAAELTKGLNTDMDKVEALYDFTSKNFRYVSLSLGMGRYQPHAADEVLRNQYGDCKDKNTLLAALLEAEGFHSSSVLIGAVRKLDPDVPSPSQFNHVITLVPVGKEEAWLDTTPEVAPFRLLSYPLRKKLALVIPPNGGTPRLEETPATSPLPDTEILHIDGKVDGSGKLDANVSYEMRGDLELPLRLVFRNLPKNKWNDFLSALSARNGLGKEISDIQASDPTMTREPFRFSYHVTKPGYLDLSRKKSEIKLPLEISGLNAASAKDADDPEPIDLGPALTREYRIKLELPPQVTGHAPLAFSMKRDYAEYDATYAVEGNVLTATRKLKLLTSKLPSDRVQDYLAFRRSVGSDLAQQISFESSGAAPQQAGGEAKSDDLVKRGNDARRKGNFGLAIELLNKAVEQDPKSGSGWNDLGLAYFESREDGLAINAYQKQIAVNAFDPRAYNNLGRVYFRERNYEEAEKWFRKQIEVDPLDKYAHANLGLMYLEQHKFETAVPELEKAASLTPDDAEAQVRLGEAYLNLGDDPKAMAAFDKAVTISSGPTVWNGVAYQLSLKGVHLDRARQYAESAVTTTETALRNVNLDQAATRDLGRTRAMASYWDTLGWVEFANSNYSKAEKYVLASWQLGQREDSADHLGQIYEKLGDKDSAIHFYALALSARRPEPETHGRLLAAAGSAEKADAATRKANAEFGADQTLAVKNPGKLEGKAEFLILYSNSPDSALAVDGAKLVHGDDKLNDMAAALRSAIYPQTFPQPSGTKLLRRGTLTCTAAAQDCSFVLELVDDARSVE